MMSTDDTATAMDWQPVFVSNHRIPGLTRKPWHHNLQTEFKGIVAGWIRPVISGSGGARA
jgi:hypothetical protein